MTHRRDEPPMDLGTLQLASEAHGFFHAVAVVDKFMHANGPDITVKELAERLRAEAGNVQRALSIRRLEDRVTTDQHELAYLVLRQAVALIEEGIGPVTPDDRDHSTLQRAADLAGYRLPEHYRQEIQDSSQPVFWISDDDREKAIEAG